MDDFDIIIDEKAGERILTRNDAGQVQQRSLSDVLALMKQKYEEQKSGANRIVYAKLFSWWIDKAYFYGVVKEGKALSRKLQECNAQKEELQVTIDEIVQRNAQLEDKNTELQARLDQMEKVQDPFRRQNQ